MRVATLNLRNTADRWLQRRHLLVRQLVDLAPDVIGVQEVRMFPDQGRWLVRAVDRHSGGHLRYGHHRRAKTGPAGLWEGVGVLARVPVVATAWLDLAGQARVAQRVTVRMPEGGLLDFYNTHLGLGGEAQRAAQAERILDWMECRPPLPAVLAGDFNARPGSPTIELISRRLRSAHALVHGREPARTVATGSVLDYIFVSDQLSVGDVRVAFDEAGAIDPTLTASDHYGLVATVTPAPGPAGRGLH